MKLLSALIALFCRICPILGLFQSSHELHAQQPAYKIFSTEDGLPSDELYDVMQDRHGNIWINSDRGVVRYDGYVFKTLSTQNGLASNTNFILQEDKFGRIWTNSFNGIFSWCSTDTCFQPLNQDIIANGNFYINYILSENGTPITTQRLNLVNLNDIKSDLRHFKSAEPGLMVWPEILELRSQGYRVYPTDSGKTIRNGRFYLLAKGPGHALIWLKGAGVFRAILNGNILFAHTRNQLISWDIKTNIIKYSPFDPLINYQNLFYDSSESRLLACTRSGLLKFVNGDITAKPQSIFQSFNITACTRDREGNYWLSLWNKGLLRTNNPDLLTYSTQSPVGDDRVLSLLSTENHLFIGTSEGRVLAMDINGSLRVLLEKSVTEGSNKPIENVCRIGADTVWSSYGKSWKISGKIIQPIKPFFSHSRNVYRDRDFYYYNSYPEPKSWRSRDPGDENYTAIPFLIPQRLYCAQGIADGTVWLGTGDGLYRFNGRNAERMNPTINGLAPLRGRITHIREIASRQVRLVATRDYGLVIHTPNGWIHLKSTDNIASDMINKIFVESEKRVWLCTNKGANLLHIDYHKNTVSVGRIELFTVEQGLPSGFINDMALFSNRYYFATNKGLSYIPVEKLRHSSTAPVISQLQLSTGDSLYNNLLSELRIGPWKNNIEISFNAICFRKPSELPFYRYRIFGPNISSNWIFTSQRNVRLLNLSPGNYRFELQARNDNNIWCRSQNLRFHIAAGFTQTWKFAALLVLTGAAVLGAAFWAYRKNQMRKNRLTQQIKDAELKQKRTELDLLRNQMNPHFIYNSLNSIQSFIHSGDFSIANDYIVRFSELMRDTLQFSRLEKVTLDKELAFLKNYLHLEELRFQDKFSSEIISEEKIDTEDLIIHPLILQPLIENAVKHAFKGISYPGKIIIRYQYLPQENCVKFTIIDNGRGFSPEPQPVSGGKESLGLNIVRQRLQILSEENPGTRCELRIESGTETHSGTTITVYIPCEQKWN